MITVRLPRERSLHLGESTRVMGILNCTPDSFFSNSRVSTVEQAAQRAREMIEAGADLLDIGGESSRPGSLYVDAAEEIERVVPVIRAIREFSDLPLSIDTRKTEVARAAVDAGADMINDISALRDDPELAGFVAERGLPVILMHMRGTPQTMQRDPHYRDVVNEVLRELVGFAERAAAAGIAPGQIMIDPGIGFGKRLEDNLALLRAIPVLRGSGYPVVIGASRKSFIGRLIAADGADETPVPVEQRLAGTLAVHFWAATKGADILRVHDVRETVDALRVHSILASGEEQQR